MTDVPRMGKQVRQQVLVSAAVSEEVGAREFTAAVREGTERRLAELLGPVECAVIAVAA